MEVLSLRVLHSAVADRAAAFRTRVEMQPAGGPGTKVFPPTYAGAVYATEKRRVPGRPEPVECVLLDSVQSQANRMEEALQQAVDEGRLTLPLVEVDFTSYFPGDDKPEDMRLLDPVGRISSLQAPHRIADAILRDSEHNGTPFRRSDVGTSLDRARLQNATPLFELCPTALLFGLWDSTGPKGGLGAKFERAIVSEIVGIDAVYGVKTSSRIDPVIRKNPPLYETADGNWTALASEAVSSGSKETPKPYAKKLSKVNLGNVTPSLHDPKTKELLPGGVTIGHAEQVVVISLPALRRLRFPLPGEEWVPTQEQHERDAAARTVLAALGLCAAALADESGLDLRSRCLLYPEAELTWQVLDRSGGGEFTLPADAAIELFHEAVRVAKGRGLPWRDEPLVLSPSRELVKLVVKSQQLSAKAGGEDGEEVGS